MAVEVLIHQGAQIIETIHLLYALPFCLCCDFLQPCEFASDVILNQAVGGLFDLWRATVHSCDAA